MPEEKNITQCHHCGNTTRHLLKKAVTATDEIERDGHKWDYQVHYSLWQCSTCDDVSLYYVTEDDTPNPDENFFDVAILAYPHNKRFEIDVPVSVRRSYLEVQKVKNASPYGFAVLARRALEQVCVERGATGRSLKEKLSDLAKKDIIPENLARMADALRFLGNLGAHAEDYEFDVQEIQAIDDFLVAIIEYVYVAPAKVQRLAESIQRKRSKKQQKLKTKALG